MGLLATTTSASALPPPSALAAHLAEQARDIRLGDGELGNDDLVQRQTGVPRELQRALELFGSEQVLLDEEGAQELRLILHDGLIGWNGLEL